MDLNNVQIEIRPRQPFEGLDLGFRMASAWFFKLWLLWLGTAIPMAFSVCLLLRNHPLLALLAVWWLKPVYETSLLYWLSRAIFNERPEIKNVLKKSFSIIRPKLLSRLTIRRFSPSRSFYMPVLMLENMTGSDYSERTSILGGNQPAGFILTFICFLFENMLYFSGIILIMVLAPEGAGGEIASFFFGDGYGYSWSSWVETAIYILAMSVMAPFYIAAGFSLYITRRTRLEAWDIELNFKRLIRRKKEGSSRTTFTAALILTCAIGFMALSAPEIMASDMDESRQVIERVLQHEDFGKTEKKEQWQLKDFKLKETELEQPKDFFRFLESIARFVASLVKPLIWLAAGILAAFILYYILAKTDFLGGILKERKIYIPPEELFGLKMTKASLPENIPGEAARLLDAGDFRGALSVLYRGALYRLVYRYSLEIPASATEGECVTMVSLNRTQDEIGYFRELTRVWLEMAYGHIRPDPVIMESLLKGWRKVYEGGGEDA